MVNNDFIEDMKEAKIAEKITRNVLQQSADSYIFADVSDIKEYRNMGDILVSNIFNDDVYYIDVKDDKTIYKTNNFLAEDEVYWKDSGYVQDGFMRKAQYDYVAYISRAENTIYMLDFELWQKNYRSGMYKIIDHPTQTTYCYLNNISQLKKNGTLMATIKYNNDFQPIDIKTA